MGRARGHDCVGFGRRETLVFFLGGFPIIQRGTPPARKFNTRCSALQLISRNLAFRKKDATCDGESRLRLIRAGTYSVMPPLSATPGTELAGVIEKVGPGVTTLPHLFLSDCRVELALHWPNARGKRLPPGVQAVSVPRLSSIQIFI
jgi:hypothetical protein